MAMRLENNEDSYVREEARRRAIDSQGPIYDARQTMKRAMFKGSAAVEILIEEMKLRDLKLGLAMKNKEGHIESLQVDLLERGVECISLREENFNLRKRVNRLRFALAFGAVAFMLVVLVYTSYILYT